MTETPEEYEAFRGLFCGGALQKRVFPPNAFLGVGLHPWSVSADAREAAKQAREVCAFIEGTGVGASTCAASSDSAMAGVPGDSAAFAACDVSGDSSAGVVPTASDVYGTCAAPAASGVWLIGEVGLDFSAKHAATRENQLAAFREIAAAAARTGDKVLSIHAVQAAQDALDILRETGCLETCVCIFHWFSGTGEQLVSARRAGCLFSFGPRALATKRGRAYAAQIPKDQLLYESDAYEITL